MKLNLTTNCMEHTVLKEYLEENASATLADKINHGIFIEKDGKRLLNRKDLNGFMVYACNEARKLAAKGATSACLKSDIVFGWAIHYFEEDDIIGKLSTKTVANIHRRHPNINPFNTYLPPPFQQNPHRPSLNNSVFSIYSRKKRKTNPSKKKRHSKTNPWKNKSKNPTKKNPPSWK